MRRPTEAGAALVWSGTRWADILMLSSLMVHSSAVPIGVCTGVDVAFSNLSFLYISISFYTILKSGTLLWYAFTLSCHPH